MMELSVWEQGEQIGTVTAQQDGLFYIFICKISKHAGTTAPHLRHI